MRTTKDFTKLHPPTLQGYYENRERVTINGKRMRLGNPKHPFNKTYLEEGMWKAFEKMGLTKKSNTDKLEEIKKNMSHSFNEIVDGYIYVMSNPAWKGWYKVGMAVDSQDRCGSYQTSSPHRDYRLEYSKYFLNRKVAEEIAHDVISEISLDRNGEWFRVSVNKIRKIIKGIDYEISA